MYNYVDELGNQISASEPIEDARLTPVQNFPAQPIRHITCGAFRRRFTKEERRVFDNSPAPDVVTIRKDFEAASFVDLDFYEVHDALNELVQHGVIAAHRPKELTADGAPHEAY